MQLITENQDRFVQMLNEPITDAPSVGAAGGGQVPLVPGNAMSPFVTGGGPTDEAGYIHITQEEKQAIDRVCIY